jgi:hypothetical protein
MKGCCRSVVGFASNKARCVDPEGGCERWWNEGKLGPLLVPTIPAQRRVLSALPQMRDKARCLDLREGASDGGMRENLARY